MKDAKSVAAMIDFILGSDAQRSRISNQFIASVKQTDDPDEITCELEARSIMKGRETMKTLIEVIGSSNLLVDTKLLKQAPEDDVHIVESSIYLHADLAMVLSLMAHIVELVGTKKIFQEARVQNEYNQEITGEVVGTVQTFARFLETEVSGLQELWSWQLCLGEGICTFPSTSS